MKGGAKRILSALGASWACLTLWASGQSTAPAPTESPVNSSLAEAAGVVRPLVDTFCVSCTSADDNVRRPEHKSTQILLQRLINERAGVR